MWAAYAHLKDVSHSENKERAAWITSKLTILKEVIAFLAFFAISVIGCFPKDFWSKHMGMNGTTFFIWMVTSRQLFAAAVCFIMYIIVSPFGDQLSWFRPSRLFRSILSWSIWVPIATLSYSMYLWHMGGLFALKGLSGKFLRPEAKPKTCTFTYGQFVGRWIYILVVSLLLCMAIALIPYMLVEKPALDARRVWKNYNEEQKEEEQTK